MLRELLDEDGDVVDTDVLHSEPAQTNSFKVVEASGLLESDFQPIGVGASAASFTVCREDPVGNQERQISVTATGSAYISTTENAVCPPPDRSCRRCRSPAPDLRCVSSRPVPSRAPAAALFAAKSSDMCGFWGLGG